MAIQDSFILRGTTTKQKEEEEEEQLIVRQSSGGKRMFISPKILLITVFYFTLRHQAKAAIFYFTLRHQTKAASNFIYAGCSPAKFEPNTLYQSNLKNLFTTIAFSASQSSYNGYATGNDSSSPPGSAVYGLYQCRNDLSSSDCSACVQSAVGQLGLVCTESYAASLQLDGCFVRYSSEDFLGKLDTSVAYRKCSASTTNDGEFFRRRDDVLGDLQNGASFRVSSSGAVQGHAQCLGDLNAADCATCISQAVGQLKNACGSTLAAEVFLAQCYARYWASGYYIHSSKEFSDDDIGKTVAIIVGVVAGLTLIIILLSFLKRAC